MTRFIGFVSGKGGVGKTTATVNVGYALHQLGRGVLLLDANLVTPNLGIHLGVVDPAHTLNKFLRKEKSLHQIRYVHDSGLSFIPASPSYIEFQKTNPQQLTEIFEHLDNTIDYVLVDAPSGLGFEVSQVLKNTDEAVIVVNPNISSVMDALKTLQIAKQHQNAIAGVLVNMSHKGKHELSETEIEQILGHPIISNIRYDRKVRKATFHQAPIGMLYRFSRSARQFRKVAEFLTQVIPVK
ncbi:MinD/ParA family protein [Candidatus Woesearchaeota archaeon]|nr:MinD/ParA family protein [Candidatus Woesearchaeota archaeon]